MDRAQVAGRDGGVAVVDDVEHGERVEPGAEVRAPGVPAVVGRADGARAEAGAGRFDVPSSNGAPTTATSTPSSAPGR